MGFTKICISSKAEKGINNFFLFNFLFIFAANFIITLNRIELKMETGQEEIYSKVLRAGRRTYFFDIRETRASDYYLTITESKKFTNDDGSFFYKKHKIFLYKEDFSEFKDVLGEMFDYIIKHKGKEVISDRHEKDFKPEHASGLSKDNSSNFTDINFEDI